jgi:hypothetical protein
MGHGGPVVKDYVHQAWKGSNPNTILFYSKTYRLNIVIYYISNNLSYTIHLR